MQCYSELIPPAAVTHAVSLSFLDSKARNLIVAKTSLLQVFSLKTPKDSSADDELSNSSPKSKLVLVGEYPLSGTVTSLAAVKALGTKSGGEALLIVFTEAKLSLVEWDPVNHKISTVSIHYYEGENSSNQPFGANIGEEGSILTVDPSSRCAALKFGGRQLAILPFRQVGDELIEDGGEEGEDEPAPPSATLKRIQSGMNEAGEDEAKQTPYKTSFVLPLTALDPNLTHPVDLAFLHEYREPTFGILSATVQPSTALSEARKDILTYSVFTLDLEQRASTNLVSVSSLPSDLWKVVPLPLPVGGALLVGANEFVHVDQSGKTNAVAVNEFAKIASNFSMSDQAALKMKLENCEVELLDRKSGDLLVVLNDGSLAILGFRLLGRNVSGLSVSRVTSDKGGRLVESAPSCIASLNGDKLFIGSEDGDSTLIERTKATATVLSRKRSHAQMLGHEPEPAGEEDDDTDDLEADDDDLYASTADPAKRAASLNGPTAADSASAYEFSLQDTLPSLGPINNICFGRFPSTSTGNANENDHLELLAGTGRGRGGRLAFMSKEIVPKVLGTTGFEGVINAWNVNVSTSVSSGEEGGEVKSLLFWYDGSTTKIYDVVPTTNKAQSENEMVDYDAPMYSERTGTEFEHEGETLTIATLAKGTRILQCRPYEIRTYESMDLNLSQIIPMVDEATDAELKIVHTSFCDPYALVIRDDNSVQVLRVEESGDAEPLEPEGANASAVKEKKWLSGCLYSGEISSHVTWLFLLSEDGGLHGFSLPDFEPFFSTAMLPYLPPVLSQDMPQRRAGAKETLTEILFADLGMQEMRQPYLIARGAMNDLTLYESFTYNPEPGHEHEAESSWKSNLRFRKVALTYIPRFEDIGPEDYDGRQSPLRPLDLCKCAVVLVPGGKPSFILKEAGSLPKVVPIRAENISALIPLHTSWLHRGFGVVYGSSLKECQLSAGSEFGTGWCVQRIPIGDPAQEVRHLAFHDEREMYVVATCRDVDFYLSGEGKGGEYDDITLKPQVPQYTLHLLSARTRNIIHSHEMPYSETITSLKVMPLEVSEHTHEQKTMIVVGTGAQRGEDAPAKGAVNVFEILDVVPEPDRAESEYKLHLISREETKGAITAVESFPGGFVGTAQGQKVMIRGLKEDGSCLPVAFLDGQCYTTQLKAFGSSGMWLAADAWKGLWFGGFTQEPYKLSVVGKSRTQMEIITAEFLPFDGQLCLTLVDAGMDLHVLQYDPENPKTVSGTRLLHRSTFHLGHFPSGMTLLPSSLAPVAAAQPVTNGSYENHDYANGDASSPPPSSSQDTKLFHILTTSLTGSVGLITPVDEATYRRLGSIQTHLTSVLEHTAGLNPRAYRAVESEGIGSRGVIDGDIVARILELGTPRRAEVLGRAGGDGWSLRSDLEVLGGGGLGYL